MKDKPSEWIVISDLMAGVMAVVMLLLVLAVLQKSANEAIYQEELAKSQRAKHNPVTQIMSTLGNKLKTGDLSDFFVLEEGANRLTVRDGVFERGSACLTPKARTAVESLQNDLSGFLLNNPSARILVEGYTDNVPVTNPVIDYQRFCTVYDDNFTLSAARAREARRYVIGSLNPEIAKRVIVAGYGDSKPLSGLDPADPRNRRVEVMFLIEQENDTKNASIQNLSTTTTVIR